MRKKIMLRKVFGFLVCLAAVGFMFTGLFETPVTRYQLAVKDVSVQKKKPDGKWWDSMDQSPPDVKVKFYLYRNGDWDKRFSGSVFNDTFEVNSTFSISDLQSGNQLRVSIVDFDIAGDDDIGNYVFSIPQTPVRETKTISFDSVNSLTYTLTSYETTVASNFKMALNVIFITLALIFLMLIVLSLIGRA